IMPTARYETLFRVSQAVSSQRDPKELFCLLTKELRQVVQFDGIGILQYDEAAKQIRWHVSERCNQPVESVESASDATMACWVYERQEALVIPHLDQETRFPCMVDKLKKHGIQSACVLPLTTVHRRIGSLILASEQPDAYSEEEVRFLGVVADMAALA